jgi:uncharacterized Zn ribbon protein
VWFIRALIDGDDIKHIKDAAVKGMGDGDASNNIKNCYNCKWRWK